MAEVVLDASVVVAILDASDVFAARAHALRRRLLAEGHTLVHLDFLLAEAVTVLSRRVSDAAVLGMGLAQVRQWFEDGEVSFVEDRALIFSDVLGVVLATAGRLSFNDASLVVLQREGAIGDVASFDTGLGVVSDFRRVE